MCYYVPCVVGLEAVRASFLVGSFFFFSSLFASLFTQDTDIDLRKTTTRGVSCKLFLSCTTVEKVALLNGTRGSSMWKTIFLEVPLCNLFRFFFQVPGGYGPGVAAHNAAAGYPSYLGLAPGGGAPGVGQHHMSHVPPPPQPPGMVSHHPMTPLHFAQGRHHAQVCTCL
jgi:hypothetical protein